MNLIRNITLSACIIGIVISILDIATPNNKMKKQLRFIFSMVIIIAIVSPLINSNIEFDIPTFTEIEQSVIYEEINNTYESALIEKFKVNISTFLKEKLKINNIVVQEIQINININEDKSINIIEVQIVLAKGQEENMKIIKEIVQNELGDVFVSFRIQEEKNE